jgi:hypothetical protein
MWGYPLPAVISLIGYLYVFSTLGFYYVLFGIVTILAGAGVYLIAARSQGRWPFPERQGHVGGR